jgi:orotidine-5'-phosphate decarboxylase
MNTSFAMGRLQAACRTCGPLCVGLDTDPSYLPPEVTAQFSSPAAAVYAYNREIIDRIAGTVACCKVQIAYYEAMGLEGMKAYADTLRAVRRAGMVVISDIKRGDIADTAKAYARAHFSGDFETDIVTVNAYMGFDTLEPFIEYTRNEGKGFFVLLRTSNSGMKDIEWQTLADGRQVLDLTGDAVRRIAEQCTGLFPGAECSPVGAVVGCTEESDAVSLRTAFPDIFFLIPGYGAQGGAARIAATLLDRAGGTVNSSRGILTAWKKIPSLTGKRDNGILSLDDIADAAADAASLATADLRAAQIDSGTDR